MTEAKYNNYRLLGRSGIRVSPLCLGAMGFGTTWQNTFMNLSTTPEECEKILLRYFELGGNFIDTAANYQDGASETIIGDILQKHKEKYPRESYVLATKYSLPNETFTQKFGPNNVGNIKKNLVRTIDQSLKRLQVDYVDVLYVHIWDWTLRPEELMKFLEDAVIRPGKALHLAISDAPAWIVTRCNTLAEERHWSPFIAYQGKYSLLERSMEQEIIPCCEALGLAVVPWGVLGQGKLTGRHLRDKGRVEGTVGEAQRKVDMSETDYAVQDVVIEIAKEVNATPSQVANNFAVHINKQTSSLIAPRSVEQLEDLFKSLDFELTSDQRKRLEEVSKTCPAPIFPTSIIGSGKDPLLRMFNFGQAPKFSVEK